MELAEIFSAGYKRELVPSLISPGPGEAIDKLVKRYGGRPTRSGSNIEGIRLLRRCIADYPEHLGLHAGLVIAAPHTHWGSDDPILIRYRDGAYQLREEPPLSAAEYRPVSFVLGPRGALAYEWVDSSVEMDPAELEAIWRCVGWVATLLQHLVIPLGLNVNYRFKRLSDERPVSTAEHQSGEGPSAAALVVRADDFTAMEGVTMEQVAWHAVDPSVHRLNDDEERLACLIRQHCDAAGSANVLQYLRQQLGSEAPC